MNHTFTAIDFETAVGKRYSICQIGLVRVENGNIVDEIDMLIQPPFNEYFPMNTSIHGISARMTKNSPTFAQVWSSIKHFFENQEVVAHNASFDMSCLKQVLEYYKLEPVKLTSNCTLKIYGEKLNLLCAKYHIPLDHHNALSDAKACAKLYQMHLNKTN